MCRARVVHDCPQETLSNRTATPCDALSLPRGLSGEQVSCQSLPCARLSRRDTERITSRVMEVLDTWTDNVSCKSRAPTSLKRLSLIERLLLATPCPSQEGSLVNRSLVRASLAHVSPRKAFSHAFLAEGSAFPRSWFCIFAKLEAQEVCCGNACLYLFLCFFRFWLYFLKPHCISEHEVVHLSVEPLFLGSSIDGVCVLWLKFAVAPKKAAVLAACAYRKETWGLCYKQQPMRWQ